MRIRELMRKTSSAGIASVMLAAGSMIMATAIPAQDVVEGPVVTTKELNKLSRMNRVQSNETVVEAAKEHKKLNTFVKAVEKAGLAETLEKSSGLYTVFAPTDAAFEKLPAEKLNKLMNNPEELAKVLKAHVVTGELLSEELVDLYTEANPEVLDSPSPEKAEKMEKKAEKKEGLQPGEVSLAETVDNDPGTTPESYREGDSREALTEAEASVPAERRRAEVVEENIEVSEEYIRAETATNAWMIDKKRILTEQADFQRGVVEDLKEQRRQDYWKKEKKAGEEKMAQKRLVVEKAPGMIPVTEDPEQDSAHFMTIGGEKVYVTRKGGDYGIENAKFVETDIRTRNGVIHVVDSMIMPHHEKMEKEKKDQKEQMKEKAEY